MKLGDQGKSWALHTVYKTCVKLFVVAQTTKLRLLYVCLSLDIQMVGREQKIGFDDSYFCRNGRVQQKQE